MTREEYHPTPGQRTIFKCGESASDFPHRFDRRGVDRGHYFPNAPLVIKHGDGRAIVDFKLNAT